MPLPRPPFASDRTAPVARLAGNVRLPAAGGGGPPPGLRCDPRAGPNREFDQNPRAGPPRELDHPASWTPHPPQAGHVRCGTRGFRKLHNTRGARGGGVCCSLRVEAAEARATTSRSSGTDLTNLAHRPHEVRAPTSQTSRTDLTNLAHRPQAARGGVAARPIAQS